MENDDVTKCPFSRETWGKFQQNISVLSLGSKSKHVNEFLRLFVILQRTQNMTDGIPIRWK